jgi:hypothetical protein
LGICDTLQLDARGTLKSGGRPFKNIRWSLDAFYAQDLQSSMFGLSISTMTSVYSGSRMMESMTIATSSNDLNVLIPMRQVSCPIGVDAETEGWTACWNETFLPAGQYKMRLALSNWIGGTAEVEFTFEKRNEPVPQIQIANGPKVTTSSREGLFLQGISSPSRCRSKPQSPLKYSWSVTPLFMVDGVAWTASAQIVSLKPFALASGKTFTFTFTASAQSLASTGMSQWIASVSTVVVLVPVQPTARIHGGDRLVSISETAPATYILDASFSESNNIKGGELEFYWTCYQNMKIEDAVIGIQPFDCALITSTSNYQGYDKLELQTEKIRKHAITFSPGLRIPSYTTGCNEAVPDSIPVQRCDPSVFYIFFVIVHDKNVGTSDGRLLSDSAKVEWSTSGKNIPEVKIKAIDSTRISSDFNVACEGNVGGTIKPRYLWVQLGPAGSDLLSSPSNLLTIPSKRSLVVKPGLLRGADRFVADSTLTFLHSWTAH